MPGYAPPTVGCVSPIAVNTFTFHHKSLPLCFLLSNLFSELIFSKFVYQKSSRLRVLWRPKNSQNNPCIVRKYRSHKEPSILIRTTQFVKEFMSHTFSGFMLISQSINFLQIQYPKFPVCQSLHYGGLLLPSHLENIAELERNFG